MYAHTTPAILQAESVMLGVLGSLLYDPADADLYAQVAEGGLLDELPYAEGQPLAAEGVALMRGWVSRHEGEAAPQAARALADEHFKLYLGIGKPPVPIWESVYFNDAGLVFQQQMLDVRAAYKEFGLQIERKNKEPDDHLALELLFVSYVAGIAATALDAGNEAEAQRALAAHDAFLQDHTLCWVEDWLALTRDKSRREWLTGLACLIVAALRETAGLRSLQAAHTPLSRAYVEQAGSLDDIAW